MAVPKLRSEDRFEYWVRRTGGITAVGRLLKLSPSAVCRWMKKNRLPTPKNAEAIIAASGGRLTYQDIYERF